MRKGTAFCEECRARGTWTRVSPGHRLCAECTKQLAEEQPSGNDIAAQLLDAAACSSRQPHLPTVTPTSPVVPAPATIDMVAALHSWGVFLLVAYLVAAVALLIMGIATETISLVFAAIGFAITGFWLNKLHEAGAHIIDALDRITARLDNP